MQADTIKTPDHLTLALLSNKPGPEHRAARQFCLDVIKEFYGFDYRQDWHADLDSLLLSAVENHYSAINRGAFWTLSEPGGDLVATAAIRHLGWKPNLVTAFAERYPNPKNVASLWRLYVRKDARGKRLGTWLNDLSEREAARLGYASMYLHATSDAAATIGFWTAKGYERIGEFGESIHFGKPLRRS